MMPSCGTSRQIVWPSSTTGQVTHDLENGFEQTRNHVDTTATQTEKAESCTVRTVEKYRKSAKMIILALFPTTALLVYTVLILSQASQSKAVFEQVKNSVSNSLGQVGNLVHRLQVERGATVFYVSSERDAKIREQLQDKYHETDIEINKLSTWRQVNFSDPENKPFYYFESKSIFQQHITDYRENISLQVDGMRTPLDFYSEAIERIISWFLEDFVQYQQGDEWTDLVAYQFVILAKEHLGVERALGAKFFAMGGYEDLGDYLSFVNRSVKGNSVLYEAMMFSEYVEASLMSNIFDTELHQEISAMREEILQNNHTQLEPDSSKGDKWFTVMTDFIDLMLDVQYNLTMIINLQLEEEVSNLQRQVTISALLLAASLILSPMILQRVAHQTIQIEKTTVELHRQADRLKEEKFRADSLLYQMLPKEIADSLKVSWDVAAEGFEEATIFFSDVVNFTDVCSECTPLQVVVMLNTLYQTLDAKIEMFDAYKLETIGDAYVVVSGIPRRNGDRHVHEICCFSLDARDTVGKLPIPHTPTNCFQLRIGIHTGPCAAGVVGYKMPRYCLFGDSVNTAARMESTGKPSKIHISSSTYHVIKSSYNQRFKTESRGVITVKGKGNMMTYWLEGSEDNPSEETNLVTEESSQENSEGAHDKEEEAEV